MNNNLITKVLRGGLMATSLVTLLLATASPAHAGGFSDWVSGWFSWLSGNPSWWSSKPPAVSTPEIDAGLVRSAAAIVAGGLIVLRGRKKRPS